MITRLLPLFILIVLTACSSSLPLPNAERPAPMGDVLFADDFSVDRGWSLGCGSEEATRFENEQLLVVQRGGCAGPGTADPSLDFDDFILEVDTRWLSGPVGGHWGIAYRIFPGTQYEFQLSNDGRYWVGSRGHEITSGFSDAISRDGGTNKMRIEAEGSIMRFFVNGEFLAEVMDERSSRGGITFYSDTPTGEAFVVSFDNLVVAKFK